MIDRFQQPGRRPDRLPSDPRCLDCRHTLQGRAGTGSDSPPPGLTTDHVTEKPASDPTDPGIKTERRDWQETDQSSQILGLSYAVWMVGIFYEN